MKITITQTIIVIEDDNTAQSRRQPPVDPFLELIQRLQWEMANGRDAHRIREEKGNGPYVPQ